MSFIDDFNRFESDFPLKRRSVNGLTFNYRMGGGGKSTLVLLVGGLGFSDMFYKHITRFSEKYRVITFDYPGETYHNSELAQGINQLIDELGLDKIILAGQSFGGLLAQVIAREYPNRVEALILSNTGALTEDLCSKGREEYKRRIKVLQKTVFLTHLVPLSLLQGKFQERLLKNLDNCRVEEKPYFEEVFRYLVGKITKKNERHMCRLMVDLAKHGHMKKEDFSYLEENVLLLLSSDDDTFCEEMIGALIGVMPKPVVNRNIEGGHVALLFNSDKYVDAVTSFLSSKPAPTLPFL
jgi:pimeloyl-ACP methyl ester carboxylesterase